MQRLTGIPPARLVKSLPEYLLTVRCMAAGYQWDKFIEACDELHTRMSFGDVAKAVFGKPGPPE